MRRTIFGLLVGGLTLVSCASGAADTITVVSDTSTLAAGLGAGAPTMAQEARLDSGNTAGLTFAPAVAAAYTFTAPPPGAPAGTETIAIPPDDPNNGQSGFFEVTFTLPTGFFNPSLAGAGNVDDGGTVFLNGTAITSVNYLDEYDNNTFGTTDSSRFQSGTNVLLISDSNSGGGPSGAAFYATVTFNGAAVPEPSGLALLGLGAASVTFLAGWRRRRATA